MFSGKNEFWFVFRIFTTGDVTDIVEFADIFHYDDEYGLDEEYAKEVSDHYPVSIVMSSV